MIHFTLLIYQSFPFLGHASCRAARAVGAAILPHLPLSAPAHVRRRRRRRHFYSEEIQVQTNLVSTIKSLNKIYMPTYCGILSDVRDTAAVKRTA